ncbi:MAG: NAD(P)-binding protein [Chitinophagaceae bacterium]
MQRRKFLTNLAITLPVGLVVPDILFGATSGNRKIVTTKVLILGAGNAGMYIAQKLADKNIESVVLEPTSYIGENAGYNTVNAGFIRQTGRNRKTSIKTVSASEYDAVTEKVILNFTPTSIQMAGNSFIVRNDQFEYRTAKIIFHLPVEIDTTTNSIAIKPAGSGKQHTLFFGKKRNGKRVEFHFLSSSKIDDESVLRFIERKTQGIMSIY